ncbi:hypothetical protein DV736_g2752, partial [Chaetothyriales sp. CBS 134916]
MEPANQPSLSSVISYLPLILLASPSVIPLHLVSAALDLDVLHLTLGCQAALSPALLNNGEFPACAAMTTGYVFRVENEATVHFLQAIGITGALTHLKPAATRLSLPWSYTKVFLLLAALVHVVVLVAIIDSVDQLLISSPFLLLALYVTPAVLITVNLALPAIGPQRMEIAAFSIFSTAVCLLIEFSIPPQYVHERRAPTLSLPFQLSLLGLLVSRILFIYLLRQRTGPRPGWHGAAEPGVRGSLLVLLSRDRWVRLDGQVDDLKAVTSGSWLQPATAVQEACNLLSCLLVWMSVVSALAARDGEKVILVLGVLLRHLATSSRLRRSLLVKNGCTMQGRVIKVEKSKGDAGVVRYGRRLAMAEELIEEFGRRDWAEQMGMVKAERKNGGQGQVIM